MGSSCLGSKKNDDNVDDDDDGDGVDADDDDYKLCVSFNLLGQAFLAPGTGESKSMQKHYQEPSQWDKSH